jgi:diacylglycerol kinase family enzyme
VRALLVFNPNATTTDEHVRNVIASALASEVKQLDVQPTKQRGQAIHIAAGAVHEGFDVVFALGGDGTANEVIQALAGTGVRLGVLPGGGTNVLARALGIPRDPVEATSFLLAKLRAGASRTVNLGRAGSRYFAFNAGYGFDASVVSLVERRPRLKRAIRQMSFVAAAFQEWFLGDDRRHPAVHVDLGTGQRRGPYPIAIVGNADPYTYLGPRPLRATPDARFECGLDLVAIRRTSTAALLGIVGRTFTTAAHLRRPDVDHWHDLAAFRLIGDRPLALQVDGDHAGYHAAVSFHTVPDALHVLA